MKARDYWWAHQIAIYYHGLNPNDVKKWPAEDILEALAWIAYQEKNKPK